MAAEKRETNIERREWLELLDYVLSKDDDQQPPYPGSLEIESIIH